MWLGILKRSNSKDFYLTAMGALALYLYSVSLQVQLHYPSGQVLRLHLPLPASSSGHLVDASLEAACAAVCLGGANLASR